MKKVLTICFLLFASFSVCAQQQERAKKSDRESKELKGAIKQVELERGAFDANDGLAEERRRLLSIEFYDQNGNLIQEEIFKRGVLYRRNTYFEMDRYKAVKTYIEIDVSRRFPKALPCKPNPRYTSKIKYEYDKQGNIKKKLTYNYCGQQEGESIYQYDSNGLLMKARHIHIRTDAKSSSGDFGLTINYVTYKRDDKGNVIEEKSERSNLNYSDYEFDEKDNWIKRKVKYSNAKDKERFLIDHRIITYY